MTVRGGRRRTGSVATAAASLNRCFRARTGDTRLPALILMTDAGRLDDASTVLDRLPRGSMVIFRHYGSNDRVGRARHLMRACRRRGLRLLIAVMPSGRRGRIAGTTALQVGADGLHLSESMTRRCRVRRPGWIVTAAAHSVAAVHRAARPVISPHAMRTSGSSTSAT